MLQKIKKQLEMYNQQHLLRFFDQLTPSEQDELLQQLEAIDWKTLSELIDRYVLNPRPQAIPDDLEPAPYFPVEPKNAEQRALYDRAQQIGEKLIREGKVAALTVAGGQGSRLGFDGPKGTFPITPIKKKSLFQYFAESIARLNEKYGITLRWYIMTSQLNDTPTKEFFAANDYFGLMPESIKFFVQGTMPAIGYDGKLLMKTRSSLALAPDGHGGTLLALRRSGSLDEMAEARVDYISYFQIDNPLVSILNPLFIGLHHLEESAMSAIMLAKTGPHEKLGNFCVSNGKTMIIEYSDMPTELAEAVDEHGKLRFIAGSPAIHVISREFVDRLTASGRLDLPWHRADKKIPCIDEDGNPVNPEEPNGVKLESFIFDALPLAPKTMLLEARREDEFAPTKNRTGVDSVESCRRMLIERDRRRLEKAGARVPGDKIVEISPRVIVDDADAIAYVKRYAISEIDGSTPGVFVQ